jgi:hypothetical protein
MIDKIFVRKGLGQYYDFTLYYQHDARITR